MNVTVCLNFFNERDDWLREAILSTVPFEPRLIVCADGKYDLYPDLGARLSPRQNYQTIQATAIEQVGAMTALVDRNSWRGNEVEKRQKMIDLALRLSQPEDFLMLLDSDWVVEETGDALERLQSTTFDAAEIGIYEGCLADGSPGVYPLRMFMRATEGLSVGNSHDVFRLPDGRIHRQLGVGSTVPALDLTGIVTVHHRTRERDQRRLDRQRSYYKERDSRMIES